MDKDERHYAAPCLPSCLTRSTLLALAPSTTDLLTRSAGTWDALVKRENYAREGEEEEEEEEERNAPIKNA